MNYKDININFIFKHLNFNIINYHLLNYEDIIVYLIFKHHYFNIINYH